jgi:hypothetical protein
MMGSSPSVNEVLRGHETINPQWGKARWYAYQKASSKELDHFLIVAIKLHTQKANAFEVVVRYSHVSILWVCRPDRTLEPGYQKFNMLRRAAQMRSSRALLVFRVMS